MKGAPRGYCISRSIRRSRRKNKERNEIVVLHSTARSRNNNNEKKNKEKYCRYFQQLKSTLSSFEYSICLLPLEKKKSQAYPSFEFFLFVIVSHTSSSLSAAGFKL